MLLAVDIGNSKIKFGLFQDERLALKTSIPTNSDASIKDQLSDTLDKITQPVTAAIICSVVPEAEALLSEHLRTELEVEPMVVRNDLDLGLQIDYEPLSSLGTDRLVNAYSAAEKYGVPCIVCSFGTATTIDVVDDNRTFRGGIIAPGMQTMARSLNLGTARLPDVAIERPASVIRTSTVDAIRSGIFFGQIGLVEGLLDRMRKEIGDNPKVIATGGFAELLMDNSDQLDVLDENLLLDGLHLLDRRLRG